MNVGALHTTVVLILLIYGQERQSSVSETPQRYPLFLSLTWMATDSRQLGSHCLTLQASRYSSPLTRARPFLPPQGSGRSTRSRGKSLQSSRTDHINHTADTNRHCGSSRCREKGETAASDDPSTTDPNTGFRFELLPVMRAAAVAYR